MTIKEKSFKHKGLQKFWESNGEDCSGITPTFAKALRLLLVRLHTAQSLKDIRGGGAGPSRGFERLKTGHCRYSLEVNGNYRLTFTCEDPQTGIVTQLNLEDYH